MPPKVTQINLQSDSGTQYYFLFTLVTCLTNRQRLLVALFILRIRLLEIISGAIPTHSRLYLEPIFGKISVALMATHCFEIR